MKRMPRLSATALSEPSEMEGSKLERWCHRICWALPTSWEILAIIFFESLKKIYYLELAAKEAGVDTC